MINVTSVISRSADDLFRLSQDYGERLIWDPFPDDYTFLNGSDVKEGTQLEVIDKSGRSMIVEYVSFRPPYVVAIKMISGPWYIREFAGSWAFKKIDADTTKVIFKYNIKPRFGFTAFILEWVFRRYTIKRIDALKLYAEGRGGE